MTAFGINLKKELAYKNLKLKDLAKKTNISVRTLENYVAENGPWPSSQNAAIIADVLDCSMDQLFGFVKKSSGGTYSEDCNTYMQKLLKLSDQERKIVFDLIDLLAKRK